MPSSSDPFDEIERFFDRMSRQFESLDPTAVAGSLGGVPVDVREEDDRFVVTADLPGYDSDEVVVTLPDDATLRIAAERESDRETEAGTFVLRERSRQSVSRTVSLPAPVEADGTEASHENGVLTVRLPKRDADGGRTIPVE